MEEAAAPSPAAPTKTVAASASAPPPSARVLLIGDSFAQGFGPPLGELARAVGLPFKDVGVKSTTIQHWLSGSALVDAMASADPTLTLVSLGANDMNASDVAAEGRRAGQLIDTLRRNGSAAVAWIAPPLMPNDKAAFRTQLAAECAGREVRVFDTPALVLERAPHDFHMTPKGYRTWADAIAAWVPFAGLVSGVLPPDVSPRAQAGGTARPSAKASPSRAPASPAPASPAPADATPAAGLPGRPLPPPHPRRPDGGRTPVDPTAPLGARAARFSYEEQRDGVREVPPGSNRGPRIDQYRRGLGAPGDPWCAFGFCFAAYAVLQPGETLPHAYTGSVAEIVRTGNFHPRGDGYPPRVGDGAVWKRNGQDPTHGGQGHIGRLLAEPDVAGRFESIEANAGDAWSQREHHVDEDGFLGWIAYPANTPSAAALTVRVPDTVVVQGMGQLAMEEYVARVVTAEIGATHETQALAALAMAARTYAVWMMQHEGLGKADKPMPNSDRKQVVARAATQRAADAARATRGGLILHRGRVVLASYVAGAIWPPGASHGRLGRDDTKTEKYVTYNDGLVGAAVRGSPIASMKHEDNRGCLSQNGAIALAQRGLVWPEILRYFYGRDLEFTCAEPAGRLASPAPRPSPPARNAAASTASGDESFVLLAVGLAVSRVLG
jgi:lysophospholipase L1-like esterase